VHVVDGLGSKDSLTCCSSYAIMMNIEYSSE